MGPAYTRCDVHYVMTTTDRRQTDRYQVIDQNSDVVTRLDKHQLLLIIADQLITTPPIRHIHVYCTLASFHQYIRASSQ